MLFLIAKKPQKNKNALVSGNADDAKSLVTRNLVIQTKTLKRATFCVGF